MRKELKALGSQERHTFVATFGRFGYKNGWHDTVPTILVNNVCLKDKPEKVLTDHLWFTCGKQFQELNLKVGDKIQFDARVDSYMKGYMGWRDDVYDHPVEKDFKLALPTRVFKLDADGKPIAKPKKKRMSAAEREQMKRDRPATDKMLAFAKVINECKSDKIKHLATDEDGEFVDKRFDVIHDFIDANIETFKSFKK